MFLVPNKKILWTIVIWFAFLQMISPLIHAHFETDSPQQGQGLHMAADDSLQAIDKTPVFKNVSNGSHTIGVNKALLERFDLQWLWLKAVPFYLQRVFHSRCRFISDLNPLHAPHLCSKSINN
jgi:hypothetical protein